MKVLNKRAKFNHELLERIEAGISLSGSEAKAIRLGHLNISQAYAKVLSGQVYLVNATILIEGKKNYNSTRSRKLLLHRQEIEAIEAKIKAKNLTLVPVSLYTQGRFYKVEIALAKSKKKFDKKASLKEKDVERDVQRELRGYKDN